MAPRPFASRFSRLIRERSGNLATLAALFAPVLVAAGAIAIDEASLFTERREAQAITDLAAIMAAGNPGSAETAALATFTDNGIRGAVLADAAGGGDTPRVTVTPGRYDPDPALGPAARFRPGEAPSNAVRVTLYKTGTRHFASSLIAPPAISTTAVASAEKRAAFSIGSRLASLDGGALNAVLGALLGGKLSLSVMDYRHLLDADIEVLSFLDALALRLHSTAVTYDELLSASASAGQIAAAIADIPGLDRDTQLAAQAIGLAAAASPKISIGDLVDLGGLGGLAIGGRTAGLEAKASALDMIGVAAALANKDRQVAFDLGAALPGLLSASLSIAIGEPPASSPWLALGEPGARVRTVQTRIFLKAQLGGEGLLSGVKVTLPVYAEAAFAEATLSDIDCRPSPRVRVAARPGVANLHLGEVDPALLSDFRAEPTVGDGALASLSLLPLAPVAAVSARAHVEIASKAEKSLTFTGSQIASGEAQSVSTHDLAGSLVGSLVSGLKLKAKIAGLEVAIPAGLTGALGKTLSGLAATLDPVLDGVLALTGVRLGEADIRVTGVSCRSAVLVQ